MKSDSTHIKQIKIVSNTHWDREFKLSFEKTRRRLLDMMDTTLDILEKDPAYHSFTMDAHTIMIDDYLEMRPGRREQVERLVKQNRLIIGPWFTLSEDFNISHEALIRNLLLGRKSIQKYGGKPGTVAYKPASWGQTGQLPQILANFGLDKVMFYRGISHHECDAEWIWEGVDGTRILGSRFALYARYNWYYLVHRPVTVARTFEKDYKWGQRNEVPFRFADSLAGDTLSFDIKKPVAQYDKSQLKAAIEKMIELEGPHFTTEVFLAMHGHDISAAHPLESEIIKDAQEIFKGKYKIEHTDLESYWAEIEKHLKKETLPVLSGERRSYLKEGKWTYLFPATISARTYLKQKDFAAYTGLVYHAEPLAFLSHVFGTAFPQDYLDRGWHFLMSNHTHDANGGCAPDVVCKDVEYRLHKVSDINDIVVEDAMAHIAINLSPDGLPQNVMQLIVFNSLPVARNAIVEIELEIPHTFNTKSIMLESDNAPSPACQAITVERSGAFVENIWDVPTIIDSDRIKFFAKFDQLPSLGYRTYIIKSQAIELRHKDTMITGENTMENEYMSVEVNSDGSINMFSKETNTFFENLNYLSDESECGDSWQHKEAKYDRKYNTRGVAAKIAVTMSGPLVCSITAEYEFAVPKDCDDGISRNHELVYLPIKIEYILERGSDVIKIRCEVDNMARDHWLRANFPTNRATDVSWADSHFDVVARPITKPDPTGWVEKPGGTYPLRTFVDISDDNAGLTLFTKGLFEYEVLEDRKCTLSLSLIRACRIKIRVSEEKCTEMLDSEIQCPGHQVFEYALCAHMGNLPKGELLTKAALYYVPVRAAMTGRGRGQLPLQAGVLSIDNAQIHVSAIKQAEDKSGIIVRLFNPSPDRQNIALSFGFDLIKALLCRMDESEIEEIAIENNNVQLKMDAKKIVTLKIILK